MTFVKEKLSDKPFAYKQMMTARTNEKGCGHCRLPAAAIGAVRQFMVVVSG